jgi:hypothetical protein
MTRATLTRVLMTLGVLLALSAPASAQIDLTGSWDTRLHEDWMERCCGRDLGDYTGIALNDEARAKALSWDASLNSLRERQCLLFAPWTGQYQPRGIRIWSEVNEAGDVVAWKISGHTQRDIVTIWMDGRPHPSPSAFHDFSGFTTGKWEGDRLTAVTTHQKAAALRRSNGMPKSDMSTVTVHLMRHDDLLTIVTIDEDPIYLAEPLVISRTYVLEPRGNVAYWEQCNAVTEIPRLEGSGIVPSYLPGENPNRTYMAETYGIPQEAAMGYGETLYPEFRKKIRNTYKAPEECGRYCCGWLSVGGGSANPAPTLSCNDSGEGSTVAESGR